MRGLLKTHSDALNIVASTYPDVGGNSRSRADEQEPWTGVDPLRLIDLLENIDGLKQEVQERMRRVEAVNQAKSLLQEDAIRTEALNRKLAELGRAFGEVRHEPFFGEAKSREADLLRMPPREHVAEISSRQIESASPAHQGGDWIHFENRELATLADIAIRPASTQTAPLEPVHRLADTLRMDATAHPVEDIPAPELEEPAVEVKPNAQPEATESPESYRKVAHRFTEASLQRDEAIQSAMQAKSSYEGAMQLLEEGRQIYEETREALLNTKLHLEQASAQLAVSRGKEEAATADLKSAQQDLTTAYQFAAVAAQRQHDAAEFFRKSNRWNIIAVAFSWVVITWMAWLQFRTLVPIWGPGAVSGVILVIAILVNTWGTKRE